VDKAGEEVLNPGTRNQTIPIPTRTQVASMSDTLTLDADLETLFKQLDALPLGKAAQLVKAMEQRWGVSRGSGRRPPQRRPGRRPLPDRGEDQLRRRPQERRRQQDQRDQGRPRADRPRPQGSQDAVENPTKPVKEGVTKEEAEAIKKKMTDAGAEVEIK
jgi:large subunit ribosomal protein L7/L12